ncbi:16S rRNA (guanine(966)-N(2))-methyltransferase RsmD [Microlunatus panaciterrae]|uniref:16S rRNA (Guanine966-N2)-methyltransferase n=1 Tax=Microlunatus panaciterrae TaxID=400768 RepID=A0ABS2RQY5_9ACTN|nr:16S rRNA (guanine966-N2)-methyltransferase [Microlunatus panaciterrae]
MSRIIAGSRGGRRLTMPATDRTRPTTDRVREALFSAVASWAGTAAGAAEQSLAGLALCDLFAGSGAVGLEAASRGADPVVLVEADRRTAEVARANVKTLGLPVSVQQVRAEQYLRGTPTQRFDVVFLDPPYDLATDQVDMLLASIVDGGWLLDDGLIVVERSVRSEPVTWPAAFAESWQKRYGETTLYYATRGAP